MKVQCPSCSTVGKLPAGRIPDAGANIRCPSCSFVFFVGGPEGANLITTTADSALIPAAHPTGSQVAVDDDMLKAQRDELARKQAAAEASEASDDETESTDTSASAPPSAEPEPSSAAEPEAAAEPRAAPEPTPATPAPPVAEPEPGDSIETPSGTFVVGPANRPWKAKSNVGLVYDFPDRSSVKAWLGRRDSHDGIEVSFDGGTKWYLPIEVAGLRHAKPGTSTGPSTGRIRRPVRVDKTVNQARSASTPSSGRAASASSTGPQKKNKTVPPAMTALSAIPDAKSTQPPQRAQSSSPATAVAAGSRTQPPKKRATNTGRNAAEEARAAVEAKRAAADRRRSEKAAQKRDRKNRRGGDDARTTRYALLAVLFIVGLGAGAYYLMMQNSGREFPDTPAGVQAAWALSMINGEVEEITEASVAPHFDPAIIEEFGADVFVEQLQYFATTRSSYELMDFLDPPTRTRIDAEIRTNALERGVLTVVVADEEPHLIIGLQIQGDYAFAPTFR